MRTTSNQQRHFNMNIGESIILAIDSVKSNKLRASLTLLSIAIGVFAIMGAGTLVSSINGAVSTEMARMGENTFAIQKMPLLVTGKSWRKYMRRKPITYTEVKELKQKMTSTEYISAMGFSMGQTVKSGNLSTNPDVMLYGVDDNYFINNNLSISEGRPFSSEDITLNHPVAILGNDVIVKLFPHGGSPIGRKIYVKNHSYNVIGILEPKGALLGQSQDNEVVIPVTQFLSYYASEWEESLTITIKADDKYAINPTMDEAIGHMRTIRNVQPWQENDFEIFTNESVAEQFASFSGFLTYFGLFSGAIALIAAGVGITNIMLVSVKERTREIGIRKAVGAKRFWILAQFIIEAITLCQIGGLIGIILGIISAGLLGMLISIKLVFPVNWVILSLVICTILGVVAGVYPAMKAAKLDPIDALRYE